MLFLAEILWIRAAARIASAAGCSRPTKKLEDKVAIVAERELTMSLPMRDWVQKTVRATSTRRK